MSIELTEAKILAEQMNKELVGKCIKSYHLQEYEKLQKIGMLNKQIKDFDQLVGGKIEFVVSRGNVIQVKLNNGTSLILGPEYGSEIFYHQSKESLSSKYHLRVDFNDETVLTVRLTSMGVIQTIKDSELGRSYIYRRDFNPDKPSPLDDGFTFELFTKLLEDKNKMLKPLLVGKDAIVVGLSNSAFQDILFRARLHPKRKATELNQEGKRALYDAIRLVLNERIRLKGKDQFYDLYGKKGGYTPAMGPNMKEQACQICGTTIEKQNLGGGLTYYCPKCQK
jgi:formamidopyrimidine-DNA glycosylase